MLLFIQICCCIAIINAIITIYILSQLIEIKYTTMLNTLIIFDKFEIDSQYIKKIIRNDK